MVISISDPAPRTDDWRADLLAIPAMRSAYSDRFSLTERYHDKSALWCEWDDVGLRVSRPGTDFLVEFINRGRRFEHFRSSSLEATAVRLIQQRLDVAGYVDRDQCTFAWSERFTVTEHPGDLYPRIARFHWETAGQQAWAEALGRQSIVSGIWWSHVAEASWTELEGAVAEPRKSKLLRHDPGTPRCADTLWALDNERSLTLARFQEIVGTRGRR